MLVFPRSLPSLRAVAALFTVASLSASAETWDGGGDGLHWTDPLNWGGDLLVSGSPNLSLNIASGGPLTTEQDFAGAFSLQQLAFGGPGPFTVNASPGSSLSFDNLGAAPSLVSSGGDPSVTFNAPVTFNASTVANVRNLNFAGGATIPAGATLALTQVSPGDSSTLSGTIVNDGVLEVYLANLGASISGVGSLFVHDGFGYGTVGNLTGTNTYSGGSTLQYGARVFGDTNGIQGNWTSENGDIVFDQTFAGTMTGIISGGTTVTVRGGGKVTLAAANEYTQRTVIGYDGHLGIANDAALGLSSQILCTSGLAGLAKISAEGGARTVPNLLSHEAGVEFTGSNDLTFTGGISDLVGDPGMPGILRHTSTGTTTIAAVFHASANTSIDALSGTLQLGAPVNNGFRTDGTITVSYGATLQLISNNPVRLVDTHLGGTLIAANGVIVPSGFVLEGYGAIQGRVAADAGSLIEALDAAGGTAPLTLGDAAHFAGFFSNGELRVKNQHVTLLDRNQAVLGSITEIGTATEPGTLTAANGVFVDFGRGLTGWGTVDGGNTLAQASIINGDAAGASALQMLEFAGYVRGLGTFTDVTFSGTFSPGLSPAIVPVNDVVFAATNILLLEIGGLTPGTQFDQLDIGGTLGLDGTLDVDLIAGFNPALGDVFSILDGTTSGAFSEYSFPPLSPGLSWDTSDLYTQGDLKIVPEPSAAALLLVGIAGALARRRR